MLATGDDPLVSIVTPSYNQGRYIDRTIRSVLTQDYRNLDYIVMDGCSSDETLDVLRQHEGQLRWVSERDRGQCDALNKGFALAKGDIFGWLNSDDLYFDPGVVSAAVAFLLDNPSIDLVYGDFVIIDESDTILEVRRSRAYSRRMLRVASLIPQPTIFFRRRIAEQFALDLSYEIMLDTEWLIRVADRHRIGKIHRIQAAFRHHKETKLSYIGMERLQQERKRISQEYPIGSAPVRIALRLYSKLQGAYYRIASRRLAATVGGKYVRPEK